MANFVLVPGANHGGWWYAPVVERLESAGHRATAVTLPGLDPEGPPAPSANLDSHVAAVVGVLDRLDEPAILVGHSYGGSVITGAADARAGSVAALVYLDAFVPADGDSCWSMTNDWERQWYVDDSGDTGLGVAPLPFFDQRARPHPIGTLLQRSRLTGAWRSVPDKRYVVAGDPAWLEQSPFPPTVDRLRADPEFLVVDTDSTHNFLRDGPELLTDVLLAAVTPSR